MIDYDDIAAKAEISRAAYVAALADIKAAYPRKPAHIQRLYADCAANDVLSGGTVAEWIATHKARVATANIADRKLRGALRAQYDRYRITCAGMVEVYGPMPNNGRYGWYVLGDRYRAALVCGVE